VPLSVFLCFTSVLTAKAERVAPSAQQADADDDDDDDDDDDYVPSPPGSTNSSTTLDTTSTNESLNLSTRTAAATTITAPPTTRTEVASIPRTSTPVQNKKLQPTPRASVSKQSTSFTSSRKSAPARLPPRTPIQSALGALGDLSSNTSSSASSNSFLRNHRQHTEPLTSGVHHRSATAVPATPVSSVVRHGFTTPMGSTTRSTRSLTQRSSASHRRSQSLTSTSDLLTTPDVSISALPTIASSPAQSVVASTPVRAATAAVQKSVPAPVAAPAPVATSVQTPLKNHHATPRASSTTSSRKPSTSKPTSITVNKIPYLTLKKISQTNVSSVFRVISNQKEIRVVKVTKLDPNEVALLTQLKGERNVVQLVDYEICKSDNTIRMVFENGQIDLESAMKQNMTKFTKDGTKTARVSRNFIRHYWPQMLECVETCHKHKVIHLDLKPANFVLVDSRLKLIDFGISKQVASDATSVITSAHVGTLSYMSPESIEEKSGSHRLKSSSDIWSLGCILYRMVYGRTPFHGLSFLGQIRAITDPKHVIEYPPIDDHRLLDVMKICLQRDATKRPTLKQLMAHPYLSPASFDRVQIKQMLMDTCKQIRTGELSADSIPHDIPDEFVEQLYLKLSKLRSHHAATGNL
jgi:serine/threonine-protein kinase TTK/MPS1